MQAPWKRAASIALAASWTVAALTGCKQPSEVADDAVTEQLVAANNQDQAHKPGQDPSTIVAYYQKAAAIPEATDAAKSEAQIAFADASVRAADELMRKIEDRQVQIVQLATLIEQQAARISNNNAEIAALKALEPKTAEDALGKQMAAALGGSDGAPWIAGDVAPIPSSAGAKAQAATLKDQIDKLTTSRNNLQTQRAQVLQQAQQLFAESEAAKGKDSIDLFIQSAGLTKQAGQLAAQSDAIDSQIAGAKQDLAVAQAAQTQIALSIDFLDQQSSLLQQGWSDVQKLIQERADMSAAILNSPATDASAAPPDAGATAGSEPSGADLSIVAAAAQIDLLKGKNIEMRDQAEKYLNDAINALQSALAASSAVARGYSEEVNDVRFSGFPQRDAWQALIDVHNPTDIKLAVALTQLRLARLYSDRATTSTARARAAKALDVALKPAGLTGPQTLTASSIEDEVAEARKGAEDAYSGADALLDEIADAPAGGMLAKSAKEAAETVHIFELYARSQFSAAMGDQKAAQGFLTDSKRVRDDALASNIDLPTLPDELMPPSAPATSAPSEAPASAPTPSVAPAATPAAPVTPPSVLDTNIPPTPAPATPTTGAAPQ